MKWQFELSDLPKNPQYPITGYQVNEGGVKKGPFYFSIQDLTEILLDEPETFYDPDEMKRTENNTPVLPFGTIRYSCSEDRTAQRISLEIPKKQWEIRYGDQSNEFYTIGFPRMIIQYLVITNGNLNRIDETRIYAVENNGKPITDETELYAFPYPNVGKSNGIVCWGANQRLTIDSLVELERLFQWFVAAPFNEDHGVRTTHGIGSFRKLIEVINDLPFNDEWLMPMKKTFGDLIAKN